MTTGRSDPMPANPPRDMTLEVHKELPEGYVEEEKPLGATGRPLDGYRSAKNANWEYMHFCEECGGWIEGFPYQHEADTLNEKRKSGRKGTVTYCLRCARQIGFGGWIS